MSDNRKLFGELPDPLIVTGPNAKNNAIGDYLPLSEQYRLSRLDKRFHTLFQIYASEYVQKFLNNVIRGNEAEVIKMLELEPGLLLEYGTVKDYSGRTFKKRTAFEHGARFCTGH